MKRAERALPWLLPLVALLANLRALVPDLTYYFRDFLITCYPLKLFAARELREGRWAFWNPYLHEGTFALPSFYPADVLLALHPTPEFASWLLTLHLPLAALGVWALARDLDYEPAPAFASGACYALGGFALSTLNLHWYLQALALAPWLAVSLRRAALRGGRAVPLAAALLGASLSTLAVEFVGQALLFGAALALEARRDGRAVARVGAAVALGLGVGALPVALMLGILPETQRGAGFEGAVSLANSIHPVALLQTLVAGLFNPPESAPGEIFWGGRFFSRSFPYFLSLYLGPVVAALAAAGFSELPRPRRWLLGALALLATLYALGPWGGIARLLLLVPGLSTFRFPSKAFLSVHLVAALLTAGGIQALAKGRRLPLVTLVAGSLAALAGVAGVFVLTHAARTAAFFGFSVARPEPLAQAVALELLRTAVVAGLVAGIAWSLRRGWLQPQPAALLTIVVLALDLARAGAGLNPQVAPSLLQQTSELRALQLDRLQGQRVFSYETEQSPALRAFLESDAPQRVFASLLLYRRVLGPFTNLLDRVETAWGKDLLGFGGAAPELQPEDYEPRRLGAILPRLREAAVARIVSLDPLEHPELELLARAPAGAEGVHVYVYALRDPLPRAYVACRVVTGTGPALAYQAAVGDGFDGRHDVALEAQVAPSCSGGQVARLSFVPGAEAYEVVSDGTGLLVMRDSYARAWSATRDGASVPVLRANGKYRAVPLLPGRQSVKLHYDPPGRGWGLVVSALALLAVCVLSFAPGRSEPLR